MCHDHHFYIQAKLRQVFPKLKHILITSSTYKWSSKRAFSSSSSFVLWFMTGLIDMYRKNWYWRWRLCLTNRRSCETPEINKPLCWTCMSYHTMDFKRVPAIVWSKFRRASELGCLYYITSRFQKITTWVLSIRTYTREISSGPGIKC